MKDVRSIFALSLFCLIWISSHSQGLDVRFYQVEGQNVQAAGMTRTANGNLALLYQTFCYNPGGGPLEPCPIDKGLFFTDAEGDTLWSNNFSSGHGWLQKDVVEQSDGSMTIFENRSRLSGLCLGFFVFEGLNHCKMHRISPDGNIINSQSIIPNECSLKLSFGLSFGNDQKIMVADYEKPMLIIPPLASQLYKLDANNTVTSVNTSLNDYFGRVKAAKIDNSAFMAAYYDEADDFRLAKVDFNGKVIWSKTYFGQFMPGYYLDDLQVLSNGDVLLLTQVALSAYDATRIARFTANGDLLWQKDFRGWFDFDIAENPDGTLLFALPVTSNNIVDREILIWKLAPSGDSLSSKTYKFGKGDTTPSSIIALTDSEFLLYGTAHCCHEDTSTGPAQVFFLKDSFGSSNSNEPNSGQLTIYPNPAHEYVYLRGGLTKGEVTFRNAQGIAVLFDEIQDAPINIVGLPSGVYSVEVIFSSGQMKIGKLIKI